MTFLEVSAKFMMDLPLSVRIKRMRQPTMGGMAVVQLLTVA